MSKFNCYICNAEFDKYKKLSVHCNRKHKISYKEIKKIYFQKKDLPFKCTRCESQFKIYDSLSRHTTRMHKINSHDFFVEAKLGGVHPTCKCGCGQRTNWSNRLKKHCNYAYGHHCRVHNNWGHNKSANLKSAETRRKQFASGERKVWCDGLTKETSESVARIGIKARKENNPERAKKISETQKQQFIDGIRNNNGEHNPMCHLPLTKVRGLKAVANNC